MTKRPKKHFDLNTAKDQTPLREKDNAHTKLQPKLEKSEPAPNLAPGGTKGIRLGLPSKDKAKAKRFAIEKPGELKRTFKSIVSPSRDKDRSRDL